MVREREGCEGYVVWERGCDGVSDVEELGGGWVDRRFINAVRKIVIGSRVCLEAVSKEMKLRGSCVSSHVCNT